MSENDILSDEEFERELSGIVGAVMLKRLENEGRASVNLLKAHNAALKAELAVRGEKIDFLESVINYVYQGVYEGKATTSDIHDYLVRIMKAYAKLKESNGHSETD